MSEQEQKQPETEIEQPELNEADTAEVEQETVEGPSERIAELERELAAANATIAQQKESVVRAAAEVENIRRRSATDVEKAHKFALEKFVNELLPVIDNMERALLVADRDQEALKPMIEGVELTLKSFTDGVVKFGVEVIDPQGEAFNPDLHQAMSMQESAEMAPNTVIAVMQKGYQLNGRLLRPAMVMVSKAAPTVDTNA
ncbi:nucleotide exchange factor GrpE [Echinimonas agarilytica]|uniref:Protein GrpE n=1 Tax=Echinimonas agarilytica TaxID=1215918 RepID=A0AA41W6L5_9GAMM|nr:nucleotide exchange factor GrpE [Echinimonas agarilytica]MCM2679653.1 nucleotide exchange factor GrpE [Echinimonas agarilytica]